MFSGFFSKMLFALTVGEIVYPEAAEETIDVSQMAYGAASTSPLLIALCVALGLICVGLVVIILLQKKRASGIGASIAGSGETYFSKNKGKTIEGTLESYTKWGGFAFIVIALIINFIM